MTREQQSSIIKQRLYSQGVTVKNWALTNGYPVAEVYKVLSGERKGLYGRSHKIAKDLGFWDLDNLNSNE